MKKLTLTLAAAAIGALGLTAGGDAEMNRFIDGLLAKMTLEEKIGQLNLPAGDDIVTGQPMKSRIGAAAANSEIGGTFNVKGAEKILALQKLAVEKSRLGIPLLIGMDVIHGYETIFPIPLAMSCSWDMEAIERSARIAASEASAAGICWTFSPMVDVSRDPRWGRMAEGAGEDPFLGAEVAKAMVRGYQGKDMKAADEIMACTKHFALYGAAEAGRDYNTVDMSRQRMYNDYFLPYQATIGEGVGSFMSSFNLVEGVPATANKWLLTDVLRKEWGFKGFVVSDYSSIDEMTIHGVGEPPVSLPRAMNAGTDMAMATRNFLTNMKEAVENGKVTTERLDECVRLILEAKYKLGLFENPYKYNDLKREKTDIYTRANREEARRIAAETFVLLKNEKNLLPLKMQGKIAVIGPLSNSGANMIGTWAFCARFDETKPLVDGFRDAVGDKAEILWAKGSNLYADPKREEGAVFGRTMRDPRSEEELLDEAIRTANQADVIVAALGEASESSGESASRSVLTLPDTQQRLLEALLATGKPVVMLNFSGRPTVMTWESEHVPAIMNVWFGGSEAADAICDVVFGDVNPSGRLTATMPRNEGQIPIYYSHFNTGRPVPPERETFWQYQSNYIDVKNAPLYPFGYGLSYTTFEYSNPTLSATEMDAGGTINASVTVTNTGTREGAETVQFYIRDRVGSVARPVKELKHFERITLKPGESKTVTFPIRIESLMFYNADLEYVAETGEFEVFAGADSRCKPFGKFTLK